MARRGSLRGGEGGMQLLPRHIPSPTTARCARLAPVFSCAWLLFFFSLFSCVTQVILYLCIRKGITLMVSTVSRMSPLLTKDLCVVYKYRIIYISTLSLDDSERSFVPTAEDGLPYFRKKKPPTIVRVRWTRPSLG